MTEWLSYSLADFLLFAPRTYYRLFALHNAAVWPLQVAALASGAALVAMVFARRPAWRGRAVALVLAAWWLFVAWSWQYQRYDTINFAGRWFALAFAAEAGLLVWIAFCDQLRFARGGIVGALVAAFALVLQPLIGPLLLGRDWASVELFGIAPDPTAVVTLGLLVAARPAPWLALVIPLLWCAVTGLTLFALEAPDAWVTPAFGLVALSVAVARRRAAA
ncbi:MAG: DUF6064 family protein [Bauldia litoralis]|uniref:DUF6064 family protein n=1 Tax=Bauldia litoralis TaxID=665467 RepID=UPI003299B59F